jgi:CSLREA domain-containing protein
VLATLATLTPARGATIQVNATADENSATADNGNCTLREAILSANTNAAVDGCTAGEVGPGVVDHVLVPSGTYVLSIAGSDSTGQAGDLDLTDEVAIEGADALTTTLDANDIDRVFEVLSGVQATLIQLTLQDGRTTGSGGGVVNGGTLAIDRCLLLSNHADGPGGGIRNDSTLAMVASTLSGNSTNDHGGGIDGHGTESLVNCTVSGNSVFGGGAGGGLYNLGGTQMTLDHVTVSGNVADSGAALHVAGTLLAGNTIIDGPCDAALTSLGGNVEGPGSTCGLGGNDLQGIADLLLGPLADNGGPTPTHALFPGSPAIDAAVNAALPATDQRGVARPLDGDGNGTATSDAGAYELEPVAVLFEDGFESGGTSAWDGSSPGASG